MTWTKSQLEQVPEVYRDFMTQLIPIIDSRQSPLRINGIPLARILDNLSTRYPYSSEGLRKVAHALQAQDLIRLDELGFVQPSAKGEDFINSLRGEPSLIEEEIPPLPAL